MVSIVRKYLLALLLASLSSFCIAQTEDRGLPVFEDPLGVYAHTDSIVVVGDSVCVDPSDNRLLPLPTLKEFRTIYQDTTLTKREKIKGYGNFLVRVIDAFDAIDTNYVERIGYNFTAMIQGTQNYEYYAIGTSDYASSLSFAQHPDFRIGPYFGWRWLFLGYTFDVTNFGQKSVKTGQKFEFSIYTSMLNLDLIWRKTGSDFYLRRATGLGDEAQTLEGGDSRFIDANVIGANVYYNINHRRFSAPAVFSQSTIQRRSSGSWQVGLSITHHDIHYDYSALPRELFGHTDVAGQFSSLERLKYTDYSITGGYAYNWAFSRGWCLGLSVTPAVGYKRTSAKTAIVEAGAEDNDVPLYDSRFRNKLDEVFRRRGNVNYDVTGRLGIIYNTGVWFAGAFGVIHNFNYHGGDLRFSNTFGTVNVCVGFYFQKKRNG